MFKNKNIILYLIYTLLSSISFISPYTNLYLREKFGFSVSSIGLILIIYQITKFIFEIPTGVIADKYGKKISVIIGNILIIFSYIILLLNMPILVYISFFLKGLGYTFISGSFEALFVNSLDNKYLIKLNSIERIFFYFGIGISSAIGGLIIDILDYNTIIILDTLIIIGIFIISLLVKETKEEINSEEKFLKSSISLILSKKFLICFLLLDLVTAISFINIEDFYSTVLSNNGLNIKMIGVIIALQLFVSSLIGYIIHSVYKRLNKVKVYVIYSILQVIFALCIYLQNSIFLMFTFYILSSICFSLFAPIKYEIFQANINNEIRSTVLSIKSLTIAIGGVISYFMVFLLGKYLTIEKITIILLIITLISYIIINIILFKDMKDFYNDSNE